MHPKNISIRDYTYELPDERIAKHPLQNRDESKLLIYRNSELISGHFKEIDLHLPDKSLLVFNNTKVIHARLLFKRETGASIEILCLEPFGNHSIPQGMSATGSSMWIAMVGNAKKWKQGEKLYRTISTPHGDINLTAIQLNKVDDDYIVGFFWEPFNLPFSDVLQYAGILPLPPYLNRENVPEDEERYQTIYAIQQGSIAAPTAGLHFSFEVLDKLVAKSIDICDITLHVGAGTFKPVKADALSGHQMHVEQISLSLESIKLLYAAKLENRAIVAVGTTVARTLESLYWYGVKLLNNDKQTTLRVGQWEPYDQTTNCTVTDALEAIIAWMEYKEIQSLSGSTGIIIAPGYTFKMTDVLITNFHQPDSTLLLLVAAFTGKNWRSIYNYALANGFRFLSYGDSSVLYPHS